MHQQDDFICMQAMFFECGWVKQLCSLLPLRRGLCKAHFYDSRSFINRWLTGCPRARYGKHFERSTATRCYWYASCSGSVTDLAEEGSRGGGFDSTPRTEMLQSIPIRLFTHAASHPHQLPPLLSILLVFCLTFLLKSSSSHSSSSSCQLRVCKKRVPGKIHLGQNDSKSTLRL